MFCNDDFMNFFTRVKHRPFLNLAELIEYVLVHFLKNTNNQEARENSLNELCGDY